MCGTIDTIQIVSVAALAVFVVVFCIEMRRLALSFKAPPPASTVAPVAPVSTSLRHPSGPVPNGRENFEAGRRVREIAEALRSQRC